MRFGRSCFSFLPSPLLLCFSLLFFSLQSQASTPSHVYQQVESLVADIHAIRQQQNIHEPARDPGIQIAKTPLHVYTKGLELFEKVQRYQKANNWPTVPVPGLPTQNTTPSDVLALMVQIDTQIQVVKQRLNITSAKEYGLVPGKTPSDVYEHVWRASLLMDELVGAIKPAFVYRNTERIIEGINQLASDMGKTLQRPEKVAVSGKKPIDANIEGFKVLYQLVALERKLKIKPLRVPGFPSGNITPSDVYDTTNNILAELTRINIQRNLPVIQNKEITNHKITPNEVVANMRLIQNLLNQLI